MQNKSDWDYFSGMVIMIFSFILFFLVLFDDSLTIIGSTKGILSLVGMLLGLHFFNCSEINKLKQNERQR